MQRYRTGAIINDGAYGIIWQAFTETGDLVAIKKLKHKFRTWQECMELREVKTLKKLSHPNVLKLREVIREGVDLYFVFDFCERNIHTVLKSLTQPLKEEHARLIMYQVLSGLAYIHQEGFFHRDIKPENILCNGLDSVRVGDFALSKELTAQPLTDYCSTRWYRAPEMLEKAFYGAPVDVWAAGVVLAELFLLRPLFPGSNEVDQLHRINLFLGKGGSPFDEFAPIASPEACDLLSCMLQRDPLKRITAKEALSHPFFTKTV
eukprot:GILI01028811.1.p1 GENE.GILI01028811.1~~GILI01028811.1.p1  ORF type:complete len:263 (-),score=21.64 GILI01028811.1:52-840(-)